jgi:Cu/Ag efflux pump CusA
LLPWIASHAKGCPRNKGGEGNLEIVFVWIVQTALRRPYTVIVLALLIAISGGLSAVRTPTDIFPNINIPVISVVWAYNGSCPTICPVASSIIMSGP